MVVEEPSDHPLRRGGGCVNHLVLQCGIDPPHHLVRHGQSRAHVLLWVERGRQDVWEHPAFVHGPPQDLVVLFDGRPRADEDDVPSTLSKKKKRDYFRFAGPAKYWVGPQERISF